MSIDNVQDITPRRQYVATAAQTVFAYPFPIFADADLVVYVNSALKLLTTDYTVAGANTNTGGNVTLLVGCTVGDIVTIYRNIAIARSTNFQQNGPLNSGTFNVEIDRLTLMIQQIEESVQRALRIPITASPLDTDMNLDPANWASKYMSFDANGKPTPAALTSSAMTQAIIANLLNPRTTDEITASLVPTSYQYTPDHIGYDVRRAGATGGGVSDDRAALNAAQAVGPALFFPRGTYLINSNITFTVPLIFGYGAKLKPANGVTVTVNKGVQAGLSQVFDYSASGLVAGLKRSHVAWFGAVGDGATDDSSAINRALTATTGGITYVGGQGTYKITAAGITIPDDTRLLGDNKRACKILVGANVDGITLGDGSQLDYLYLEGNGTTGHGIVFPSAKGNQTLRSFRAINFDVGTGGGVLHFADNTAGSRCVVEDWEAWQTSGASGSDKYAVYIPDFFNASAVPRKFSDGETSGKCSFFFGGCNDIFVAECFLADLKFSANSRAVQMTANRIANQTALTIDGANHSIIGNDFAPLITIASTITNSRIGPNSMNLMPIIDNSGGNNTVEVYQPRQLYTPTLTSAGTAPVLGNGTLSGYFTLVGGVIEVVINFVLGTTTTLGTGGLRFSLPLGTKPDGEVIDGGTVVLNRGGTLYTAATQIPGNVSYVEMIRDTSGSVTFNSPGTFASGDTMRLSFFYHR